MLEVLSKGCGRLARSLGPPRIKGRFWYRDDMRGFNYEQRVARLAGLLDAILATRNEVEPPAFYAGAVPILEHIPDFAHENSADVVASC